MMHVKTPRIILFCFFIDCLWLISCSFYLFFRSESKSFTIRHVACAVTVIEKPDKNKAKLYFVKNYSQ
ncbi:hypothetical protein ASU31_12820 [Pedobacter ginsenosidimutans]|uniref:Uncharacterized protein n=1 Tax=Pedobacter ginsenosidimutans TaxID=687842 RepID=A0A0T5VRM9_9SPHI|nr:hypothetical protein ASU31_12820 [Pedobacter ginsenosidimutans]